MYHFIDVLCMLSCFVVLIFHYIYMLSVNHIFTLHYFFHYVFTFITYLYLRFIIYLRSLYIYVALLYSNKQNLTIKTNYFINYTLHCCYYYFIKYRMFRLLPLYVASFHYNVGGTIGGV